VEQWGFAAVNLTFVQELIPLFLLLMLFAAAAVVAVTSLLSEPLPFRNSDAVKGGWLK